MTHFNHQHFLSAIGAIMAAGKHRRDRHGRVNRGGHFVPRLVGDARIEERGDEGAQVMDPSKRQHYWDETNETRGELTRRFGDKVFPGPKEPKVPLKIGILQDLFDACPDISRRKLRNALKAHTDGPRYHGQCTTGAARVDLSGNPSGTVTAEEAEHAARMALGIRSQRDMERRHRLLLRAAEKFLRPYRDLTGDELAAVVAKPSEANVVQGHVAQAVLDMRWALEGRQ